MFRSTLDRAFHWWLLNCKLGMVNKITVTGYAWLFVYEIAHSYKEGMYVLRRQALVWFGVFSCLKKFAGKIPAGKKRQGKNLAGEKNQQVKDHAGKKPSGKRPRGEKSAGKDRRGKDLPPNFLGSRICWEVNFFGNTRFSG